MKRNKFLWNSRAFVTFPITILFLILDMFVLAKYLSQPSDPMPDSRYNEILNYADAFANSYQGKNEQRIPNLHKAEVHLATNIYEDSAQEDLRIIITVKDHEYNSDIRITYPVKFNEHSNAVIGVDYRQVEIKNHNISLRTVLFTTILILIVAAINISFALSSNYEKIE